MCGRYAAALRAEQMRRFFGVAGPMPDLPPRFNLAPGQDVPLIRLENGERRLALLRWGLVPSFAKDVSPAAPMINARCETIERKAAFRDAFHLRRCLFPASGFYEWQSRGKGPKQPFYIHSHSGEPFAMAGIWERWQGPAGEAVASAAIVTTDANGLLRPVHERMPAVLMPAAWEGWLNSSLLSPEQAKTLLKPAPEDFFAAYPVGTTINRAANEGPGLLRPLAPIPPPLGPPAARSRQMQLF